MHPNHERIPMIGCSRRWSIALLLPVLLCRAQSPSAYTITTLAGNGTTGYSGDGGAPIEAQLASPFAVALDSGGKLFIADQVNHRVRQIPAGGTISTVAGNGTAGYSGDGAAASSAELYDPTGVAVDSSGNLYIADSVNNVVRKVTSSGTITTFAGSNTLGAGYSGDGGSATSAQLNLPLGVAVDSAGNVYIADTKNNRIRKVTPSGTITTAVGTGAGGFAGDGRGASAASINGPRSVAVDSKSQLYIADTGNNSIRKVDTNGIITTIAGNGAGEYSGDGGMAVDAALRTPYGVAVDASGSVYVADYGNSRIRKIGLNGGIITVAGNGQFAFTGDGQIATNAALRFPSGLVIDSANNIYVADCQNDAIRVLTPLDSDGGRPSIQSHGVITAAAFGASETIAPGSWIEIYGVNLARTKQSWSSADFRGTAAPTWLNGTSVTIGGQPAYVAYISGSQLNVQVPSNLAPGAQDVVVSTDSGVSDAYSVNVAAAAPALYAPAAYRIGDVQFAGATFPDGTVVLPANSLPGVTSRAARPGDTIVLYGTGFGPVNPITSAGQIAAQPTAIDGSLTIQIGGQPAQVMYAGLAIGTVGLYQVNVVVPDVAGGTAPLTFTLNGAAGEQSLNIALQP